LEYVAQELHTQAFTTLGVAEQQAVREDAEERYISYAFLRQSGTQHGTLKMDLQNDFTTGDNRYPKTRQQTLHLLDKYSKTVVPKTPISEGMAFAQRGGRGGRGGAGRGNAAGRGSRRPFDKEYWKDKKCFKCGKEGHPSLHCEEGDDDDKSTASAKSVKKLTKDMKSMKKAFTQLKEVIEGDSDLSGSDSEEDSHFQVQARKFQFIQLERESEPRIARIEREFEPRIAKLFKQAHGGKFELDLREVILLDSQLTMDLICNPALVKKTFKSSHAMKLKSNGGTMTITHKAKVAGYHAHVWYDKKAITNILSLKNVIKQYRVTYDSNDEMFVVHRESDGKPNMEFRMHESGLHYYDPRSNDFAFVSTVSGNKEGFTKRQIKGAEAARALYSTLSYPSWKDFKWVI